MHRVHQADQRHSETSGRASGHVWSYCCQANADHLIRTSVASTLTFTPRLLLSAHAPTATTRTHRPPSPSRKILTLQSSPPHSPLACTYDVSALRDDGVVEALAATRLQRRHPTHYPTRRTGTCE
jgi:hypothetical protein